MAEDIILPIEDEPGIEVEQFLTQEGANESVVPPLPALVMAPKFIEVLDKPTSNPYFGSAVTNKLPEFETLAQVLEDSNFKAVFKDIQINILEDVNKGTITHTSDDIILTLKDSSGNSIPGGMRGVTAGDIITARQAIVANNDGSVNISDRTKLTDTTSATYFANVIPGDILVTKTQTELGNTDWKASVNPLIKEYSITEVGTGGAYIVVAGDLQVGTNLEYSVVRETQTSVLSLSVIDSSGTQTQLKGFIATGNIEFKMVRFLVPSSLTSANQPLVADLEITDTYYNLKTLVDTNDAIEFVANIPVTGFTDFSYVNAGTGNLVVATDDTLLTVTGQNLTIGDNALAAEDVIYFKDSANTAKSATIQSIAFTAGNTEITLYQAQTVDITNSVIRSSYKTATGASFPVSYANPYVTYRARSIKDVGRLITIQKVADLDQLGPDKPFNIVRVAARTCKANAGLNAIYVLITADESVGAFLEAYERAEGKLLYNIAPMSDLISVHTLGKVHVGSLSTPKKAMWRMLWAAAKKPTEKAIVTLKNSGQLYVNTVLSGTTPNVTIGVGTSVTLTDNAGDFSNVFDGYFVKAYIQQNVANTIPQTGGTLINSNAEVDSNNVTTYMRIYKVDARLNNKKLRLAPVPYSGSESIYNEKDINVIVAETSANYTVRYEVIKVLTKDEVVQTYAKTGRSFNDRRVNLVTNPACRMLFTNGLGAQIPERVPGYILGAAAAGLSSNTKPHQPLTRIVLADIYSVEGGKDEYTSDQISIMTTGGCWTFVQDGEGTGVYTWKQRTSSNASIKEKEYSVTKNVDEVSYAIVYDLSNIPGINNNVPRTRARADSQLTATLDARTTEQKGVNDSDLGPQILSYSKSGFQPDPVLADTAYDKIIMEVPLPLNKLKVGLYV